jgi:hypothetical protein
VAGLCVVVFVLLAILGDGAITEFVDRLFQGLAVWTFTKRLQTSLQLGGCGNSVAAVSGFMQRQRINVVFPGLDNLRSGVQRLCPTGQGDYNSCSRCERAAPASSGC